MSEPLGLGPSREEPSVGSRPPAAGGSAPASAGNTARGCLKAALLTAIGLAVIGAGLFFLLLGLCLTGK